MFGERNVTENVFDSECSCRIEWLQQCSAHHGCLNFPHQENHQVFVGGVLPPQAFTSEMGFFYKVSNQPKNHYLYTHATKHDNSAPPMHLLHRPSLATWTTRAQPVQIATQSPGAECSPRHHKSGGTEP